MLESDLDEAQLKQQMVAAVDRVIGVADASKFGLGALYAFALPSEIERLLTDAGAPREVASALREQGVMVELV